MYIPILSGNYPHLTFFFFFIFYLFLFFTVSENFR